MDRKTGRSKNGKGATPIDHLTSPSSITKVELDIHHHRKQPTDLAALSLILLLCCWLFSNGLHGEFVFDDSAALANNNDTKSDLTPLPQIFFNDFWGTDVLNKTSHRSYRPTVVLTFRLQHYLMGYRHDVTTLHVVNYIMAYINVCLVYYLARLYMKPHVDSADGVADRPLHVAWRRCAIPFAAALLFLAHPVHVDSVTSIVGRCELMCCFFGLCALFTEHAYLCVWGRGWHVHVGCVLLSTVLMILSVTSKDSGIAYCGVFVVHAVGIYCWKRASLRRTIMCVILSVAQVVGYFGFRMYALGALSLRVKDLRRTETPQYFVPPGVWHWLAIRWVVAMKNLELLFFPTKLAHEYAYNCVAHLETLSDERLPVFCAVTLVVLCYVCALVYRVLRHRSRGAGMQLMAVLWAVVLYAPVSHFFVTVGTFIAERCLYSSSVGVVLLLAYVFVPAEFPNTRLRWAGCAALCALVLLWMIVSHRRIPDWDSALRLYSSGVAVCPMSGKAHYLVGVEVVNRSVISYMTEEERWWFERAWELDDALVDAYGYVGLAEMGSRHYAAGYSILRRCAARSVSMCIDTLVDARAKFYVGMPAHEQLLDQADLMEDPIGALALRERAVSIAEEKAAVCEQSRTFESMRRAYESLGFVWESNSSSEESDGFLCQLAPRYVSVKLRCSSEAMAEGGGDVDGEDVDEQLAAYEITSVVDVMSRCRLRWTNPDFVEDDARLVLGLGNLSATLSAAVQRVTALLPLFEEEEIEVEVQRGLRTLIRMQYCQAHQLLRNTTLLQHVEKVYPEGLKLMRKYVETDGEMHRVSLQGTLVDSEHNNSVTSWEGYSDDALCTFPPELE